MLPDEPAWPIISEILRSGEFAQSDMILSISTPLKPGSWAMTALDAPPLAPDAVLDEPEVSVVEEAVPPASVVPPAEEVEPVTSLPELPDVLPPASAVVELPDEPEVPDEPASAEVELDVSDVPDVPDVPASADVEPVVLLMSLPVVPLVPERMADRESSL